MARIARDLIDSLFLNQKRCLIHIVLPIRSFQDQKAFFGVHYCAEICIRPSCKHFKRWCCFKRRPLNKRCALLHRSEWCKNDEKNNKEILIVHDGFLPVSFSCFSRCARYAFTKGAALLNVMVDFLPHPSLTTSSRSVQIMGIAGPVLTTCGIMCIR